MERRGTGRFRLPRVHQQLGSQEQARESGVAGLGVGNQRHRPVDTERRLFV